MIKIFTFLFLDVKLHQHRYNINNIELIYYFLKFIRVNTRSENPISSY